MLCTCYAIWHVPYVPGSSIKVALVDEHAVVALNFAVVKGTALQGMNNLANKLLADAVCLTRVQVTSRHLENKGPFCERRSLPSPHC